MSQRSPFSSGRKAISLSLLFAIIVFLLPSCNTGSRQEGESQEEGQTAQEESARARTAKATVKPCSDSQVSGEATFTEENGAVIFELTVENLTPGEHGVHLHEKADCSSPDGSSAGGHWNPTMKPHGKRGEGTSFHKGDIGNISVGQDGKGTMRLTVQGWSIGGADSTNVVGKSVIIHAAPDDFTSQPAGNAGARVGCGEIEGS